MDDFWMYLSLTRRPGEFTTNLIAPIAASGLFVGCWLFFSHATIFMDIYTFTSRIQQPRLFLGKRASSIRMGIAKHICRSTECWLTANKQGNLGSAQDFIDHTSQHYFHQRAGLIASHNDHITGILFGEFEQYIGAVSIFV